MARHTGVAWEHQGNGAIVATGENGLAYTIGVTHAACSYFQGGQVSPRFLHLSRGERSANGHMMASALALAMALGELLEASAPLLGDDDPRVIQARELVSSLVEERLK